MVSDYNNDLKRWDQESVQKLMAEIASVIREQSASATDTP